MTRYELNQYNILQKEIAYLNTELERLDVRKEMKRTKELNRLITEKINNADAEFIRIEKAIETLQPIERMIVRLRYIKRMSFWKIAIELNYSERQVYRYERAAINKLANL